MCLYKELVKNNMDKKKELMNKIAEILDEKEVSLDYELENEAFDSLGVLALSAAIDDIYDVVVSVAGLRKVRTVGEIFSLVEDAENE